MHVCVYEWGEICVCVLVFSIFMAIYILFDQNRFGDLILAI